MKTSLSILFLVLFLASCKKEAVPRLNYLHDFYTFDYTYKEVKHGYNIDTGGNEIVETNGSGSKSIEVVGSPYSEKEFVILDLLDSTFVYFPENTDTFNLFRNSNEVNTSGKGVVIDNELHFNVKFSDISGYTEYTGVAKRR